MKHIRHKSELPFLLIGFLSLMLLCPDKAYAHIERSAGSAVCRDIRTSAASLKLSQLFGDLEAELPTDNGTWSVYVCDLSNDVEQTIHEESMQAASLIKLYIMGAVYEDYNNLCAKYGQNNLDSYLNSMITVSDNEAANTLVGYLGGGDTTAGMAVVNAFCTAHGYTATSMGRLLLESNDFGDNYTSASDCGHLLKSIYEKDTLELPHAEDMFALLSAQTRRNKIPAQLPETVSVANKTGELSDVENDAAILYNTDHDLILVFLSEDLKEAGSAQTSIASLSRMCYDFYQNP
jgi:beta-lactamase class A